VSRVRKKTPKVSEGKDGKVKDPIEKLEAFVVQYGEECSQHIATGMRIHNNRFPPALIPPTPTSIAPPTPGPSTSHSTDCGVSQPTSPIFPNQFQINYPTGIDGI